MPPYMELPNPNAAPSESDIIPIIFFIYKEKRVCHPHRVTMRNSKGIGAMGVLLPSPEVIISSSPEFFYISTFSFTNEKVVSASLYILAGISPPPTTHTARKTGITHILEQDARQPRDDVDKQAQDRERFQRLHQDKRYRTGHRHSPKSGESQTESRGQNRYCWNSSGKCRPSSSPDFPNWQNRYCRITVITIGAYERKHRRYKRGY